MTEESVKVPKAAVDFFLINRFMLNHDEKSFCLHYLQSTVLIQNIFELSINQTNLFEINTYSITSTYCFGFQNRNDSRCPQNSQISRISWLSTHLISKFRDLCTKQRNYGNIIVPITRLVLMTDIKCWKQIHRKRTTQLL